MSKRPVSIAFLGACILLALLLLTRTISTTISGILFAIALVIFGGLSRGLPSAKEPPTGKKSHST